MFAEMKDRVKKILLVFFGSGLLLAGAAVTSPAVRSVEAVELIHASELTCNNQSRTAAAGVCRLNVPQPASNVLVPFGGAMVLNQTFIPTLPGPVCKVDVRIRRNITTGAGSLKLIVTDLNNVVMDSAVIPAPQLGDSVRTFDMGCDGGILLPRHTYRLSLSSPTSPMGAYSWWDANGNPYGNGQGDAPLHDFTFWVYLCAS
jgi:hypothetical protein